ncbi:MAG: hypothetical protein ACPG4U_14125 [Pseudomonadales bacterium]
MNWDAAKFWLDVAQWVVLIIVAIGGWVRTGSNQNREIITALDDRLDSLEHRVISAEERLNNAPTHEDIAKLREQYSALESKLDGVAHQVNRIADHLLNKD